MDLESIASKQTSRMQPTLPQSAGAADMDLPAVQSMDWLFKKERIFLLAQFWQQVIKSSVKHKIRYNFGELKERRRSVLCFWSIFFVVIAVHVKWWETSEGLWKKSVKCEIVSEWTVFVIVKVLIG